MYRRLVVPALALSCVLTLAACGKKDSTQPTRTIPGPTTTTTAPPTCSPTTPAVPPEGKPTVNVPAEAATTLVTNDIKVGDGAEAKDGDTVKMQYVGVSKTTGQEFDSSWSRNSEPFEFTLGPTAQVIPGWNQGIKGMKVGGRRELIIPPDLGYGASGQGDKIPANDTLVFVVDLVQVCTPAVPVAAPGSSVPGTEVPGSVAPGSSVPADGAATATTVAGAATTTTGAGAATATTAAGTATTTTKAP